MIWYKVYGDSITELEILRATKHQIVIEYRQGGGVREIRYNKISTYEAYFPTKREAFDYTLKNLDAQINLAQDRLKRVQDKRNIFIMRYINCI